MLSTVSIDLARCPWSNVTTYRGSGSPLLFLGWRCSHVMLNGSKSKLTNTPGGAVSQQLSQQLSHSYGTGNFIWSGRADEKQRDGTLPSYLFRRTGTKKCGAVDLPLSATPYLLVVSPKVAVLIRLICTPRSITELTRAAVGSGAGDAAMRGSKDDISVIPVPTSTYSVTRR